jgi:hypothetical protein
MDQSNCTEAFHVPEQASNDERSAAVLQIVLVKNKREEQKRATKFAG